MMEMIDQHPWFYLIGLLLFAILYGIVAWRR